MEQDEWKKGWPTESHMYYECKIQGRRDTCYLYFHVCRESGEKRWLDTDLKEVKGIVAWKPYKQKL